MQHTDEIRDNLDFLVNNPEKTLMAKYHNASYCWKLIKAAVEGIRRLRNSGASADFHPIEDEPPGNKP
jgi:hypothetical protein